MLRFLMGLVLAAALYAPCGAQQPTVAAGSDQPRSQSQPSQIGEEAKSYQAIIDKLIEENRRLEQMVEGLHAPIWKKYAETKQREYAFQTEMMDVNTRNFFLQQIASYVILALVVFVVMGGLWFAHIQLNAGLAPVAAATGAAAKAATQEGATEEVPAVRYPTGTGAATTIDASLQKVTVTTSVVGIIVLLISLAFLYIYTREIYQIKIIDPYRPQVQHPGGQQSPSTEPMPNTPRPANQ